MLRLSAILTLSLYALLASAIPHDGPHLPPPSKPEDHDPEGDCADACELTPSMTSGMNLPANQTVLVAPITAPRYITLGVGYQNYTCSSTTLTYS
uniref:Uncharacterized protein n=1 Tax=Mycena chlorophos TaxID=658473 RepID=A0ABQ0LNF7_MYCCL|nr:predicted protein [Mycena chlorophos]